MTVVIGKMRLFAFVVGAQALQSSSIPQEDNVAAANISSEGETPVLTVDGLIKDLGGKYADLIRMIVDEDLGGDIKSKDDDGEDFLFLLLVYSDSFPESGAVAVANLLLSKYGFNANTQDNDGNAALSKAICNIQLELAELLIQFGADVDHQTDPSTSQWTALHYASNMGHEKIVELLLENGANTDLRNAAGKTALQVGEGRNSVIRVLKEFELNNKSLAIVLGMDYSTTKQIIAPKPKSNSEGLLKMDRSVLLNVLSFLQPKKNLSNQQA